MKPQETAQERAEKYVQEKSWALTMDRLRVLRLPAATFFDQFFPLSKDSYRAGFIAGEESAQSRIKTLESALVDMAKALGRCETVLNNQLSINVGTTLDNKIREVLSKYQELLSEL
jgi:hypothetical protein